MKVFFTLDSLANGGTEKSTVDILSYFSRDTEIKVIHLLPGFDLQPAYEKAGIPLQYIDIGGRYAYIKGIRRLIGLIRKEKPDLIVSSILTANLTSRIAGLITGTPVIGTFVNDSYGAIRIEEMRRKKQYFKFRLFWLFDKWTSGIPVYWISNAVSIAQSNAKALGLRKKKIKVIYRGRETDVFPDRGPLPVLDKFRFVFVGRMLQRKGLAELITAFNTLKKKHSNITLDIFGDGLFRKQTETMIDEYRLHDAVKLHGMVPNGWKKLYDAHCFVFPSWYEGFSGALIEAMMAGIPIIASDISMNLEAVSDETALIYKVKDVDALVHSMDKMITSYPEMIQMANRAKEEAKRRFDIKVIAKEYESFLREVVEKKVDKEGLL
jgi:glycosyltransferase involved in cell wall biosynthesis